MYFWAREDTRDSRRYLVAAFIANFIQSIVSTVIGIAIAVELYDDSEEKAIKWGIDVQHILYYKMKEFGAWLLPIFLAPKPPLTYYYYTQALRFVQKSNS